MTMQPSGATTQQGYPSSMSLLLQLQALLQVDVSRATSTTLLQYAALLQVEGSPTLTTALCPNAAATSGVAAQLQQFCCSPNVVERRPCCNCNNTYVVMTSTMGAMLQPQQRPCCGGERNGGHAATATVPMLPRCCVGRIERLFFLNRIERLLICIVYTSICLSLFKKKVLYMFVTINLTIKICLHPL